MTIAATQAALQLEQHSESISPYQVIALLLDGALERLDQAKQSVKQEQEEDAELLVGKAIGIVNGLRASLDMEKGGEVAVNLDALYDYISARLTNLTVEGHQVREILAILNESTCLLSEIKSGWDGIADSGLVAATG